MKKGNDKTKTINNMEIGIDMKGIQPKHQGLIPVSHKNIIYPAFGKEQTAKAAVV